MLLAILLILLFLALFGGFAVSKLLWIVALIVLIALLVGAFSGRGTA